MSKGRQIDDGTLDQIKARLRDTGARVNFQDETCGCGESPHENRVHDFLAEDAPRLIAALETVFELCTLMVHPDAMRAAISDALEAD